MENFDKWWQSLKNQNKAEKEYGKLAEKLCDTIDPDVKRFNLYTDILELLAKENKMHIHQ